MTNPEKYDLLKSLFDQITAAPISPETKMQMLDWLYHEEMKPIRKEWSDSVLKKKEEKV